MVEEATPDYRLASTLVILGICGFGETGGHSEVLDELVRLKLIRVYSAPCGTAVLMMGRWVWWSRSLAPRWHTETDHDDEEGLLSDRIQSMRP
ncbi:hypothetical protein N7539_005359 [Penicillium diatomitis]|uniref:Uncharacterized protein n=1 Tax=Penicillium diatomitis TaxID=2819901 RepID=A0A9X0BUZ9_9EURO|nr:uncharacterized protein N7539_005359 [Penicillium diatomitis]KAJ5485371.1 hypothetical protein N7539_005359 [Penicillium diatomitis]